MRRIRPFLWGLLHLIANESNVVSDICNCFGVYYVRAFCKLIQLINCREFVVVNTDEDEDQERAGTPPPRCWTPAPDCKRVEHDKRKRCGQSSLVFF